MLPVEGEPLNFSETRNPHIQGENLGEFAQAEAEEAYDPMSFDDDIQDQDPNDEDYELDDSDVDSNNPIIPETVPMTMELNDQNSIKLKKGILVVRKYKEGHEELNQMQNVQGYSVINRPFKKSVRYIQGSGIERVKYFKKDAEPCAPALSIQEVIKIQDDIEKAKEEEEKKQQLLKQQRESHNGINKDRKRALENMKKVLQGSYGIERTKEGGREDSFGKYGTPDGIYKANFG